MNAGFESIVHQLFGYFGMNRLRELLGKEQESDSLNRTLRDFSQGQKAAAVGAVHVTCSDECEREAAESFQHWFAESLLFAKGLAGAHHLYRVHRLARGEQDHHAARAIVDEFLANVDKLPPEQARAIVDALLEHHHAMS